MVQFKVSIEKNKRAGEKHFSVYVTSDAGEKFEVHGDKLHLLLNRASRWMNDKSFGE